jgi:hypothetical protein
MSGPTSDAAKGMLEQITDIETLMPKLDAGELAKMLENRKREPSYRRNTTAPRGWRAARRAHGRELRLVIPVITGPRKTRVIAGSGSRDNEVLSRQKPQRFQYFSPFQRRGRVAPSLRGRGSFKKPRDC